MLILHPRLTCRFVGLKLPREAEKSGLEYFYADANNAEFALADQNLGSESSAVGLTAGAAMDATGDKNVFYAFYNDEHPDGKVDFVRAHMKGIVTFDENQGFWLVHSVPHLVDSSAKTYSYPETGTKFGQSFLCVTYPTKALKDIAKQLAVGQPSVYDGNVPESFAEEYPELVQVVAGKRDRTAGKNRTVELTSLGGTSFVSYQKSKTYGKDLYSGLVSDDLDVTLYVESWLNGAAVDDPPTCDVKDEVTNIRSLNLGEYQYPSALDHSKWAVSKTKGTVCIGDINRQASQNKRGGGTVCFANDKIWKFMHDAVSTYECCKDETGPQCATPNLLELEKIRGKVKE
ncbi:Deoxyribonuclease II family protein [Aphelenchoides avenae]|nr:Deoxyribonuclease II family protein [Aphelenchus avenae]